MRQLLCTYTFLSRIMIIIFISIHKYNNIIHSTKRKEIMHACILY